MKKLLISALAVLAMATSSLTLAATNDTSTQGFGHAKPKAMETEKVTVTVTGTNKEGKRINPTEVTVNREKVEGKSFMLTDGSPIVKVAENRCEKTNAEKFIGKKISAIHVTVKDGKCTEAEFMAAK